MDKTREVWNSYEGGRCEVDVLRRYITTEDVCPECGCGLRIAIGTETTSREQVYRLECLSCEWVSEALPDPEAARGE